jgi:excisionase family DNA binding protein
MAKKYLSLEEAASMLGLSSEQLMRLREQGQIRGFADRGSWKFREQDVEEFQRTQQADSSPDIPIIRDSSSSSVLAEPDADLTASDSDVRLFFDDSVFEDDKAQGVSDAGSDLRLSGDSGPKLEGDTGDELDLSGWDSSPKLSDSDSDVKLVGAGTEADMDLARTGKMSDSDSDVILANDSDLKLSDSDSDVRLTDAGDLDKTAKLDLSQKDSDSDVKLMGSDKLLGDDSDSDVKLASGLGRTDSDIRLAEPSPAPKKAALPSVPDDSDLKLLNKGSGTRAGQPDSGISLEVRGSGVGLNADESGISLEMDSGISLSADDSGISLESFDSSAKLADDSGISLDAGDSGISLDLDDVSPRGDDMSRTMPMDAIKGARNVLAESGAMTTELQMPVPQAGKDSEFELAGLDDDDDDTGSNTSVLTFEDDDSGDARTVMARTVDEEVAEEDDFDAADDDSYDDADEDQDDVHDAEEFDDEDFESGQSQVGGYPEAARAAVRPDVDWGVGIKVLIGLTTVLSILCAAIGVELVRTMWAWTQPGSGVGESGLLSMIGGLF